MIPKKEGNRIADSSVPVTAGAGTLIDTRTESTNSNHRQVMVIGDPAVNNGVAPVDVVNGLSVQVVPALPAGGNTIGNVGVTSLPNVTLGAGTAAVGKLAANAGVNVGTVDVATVAAVTPGTGATNLGKAEDTAHTSGDTGVMVLAVRNDAGTALAGPTGDYIPLTTNSAGALWVAGGGGTQFADNTLHTSGDKGTLTLAVRRDANTTLVTSDGDYAPIQVTDTGALKVAITSGAGSGGTSIADEGAFTAGSTSITPVGGIYESSPTTLSSGQAGIFELDSSRNLLVHEQYAPLAEDNTNQVIAQQIRPVSGATYSASSFAGFGTGTVAVSAKVTPGNLLSVIATNANAAVRWLQIHNKASAPASTNVPVLSLPIPAGTANNPGFLRLNRADFGEGGKYLSAGVSIGISTAEATYTAATASDHDLYGEYI